MYYDASPVAGITRLEPHVSNHGVSLVYFSRKRENVLVYLSNAVEKYCRETGFAHSGPYVKWGPYGFTKDGIQRLGEYYPNALSDTYKGVSAYIYRAGQVTDSGFAVGIPDAVTSSEPMEMSGVEFVPDAYEAILQAERKGRLILERYEDMPEKQHVWLCKTIRREYETSGDHPDYRHFLQGKFPEILREN